MELSDIDWDKIDVLINTTPVGMAPGINASPVNKDKLNSIVVFDSIYSPPVTKLIHDARKNKCIAVPGTEMFINQAVEQFKLFTGITLDRDFAENAIMEHVLS